MCGLLILAFWLGALFVGAPLVKLQIFISTGLFAARAARAAAMEIVKAKSSWEKSPRKGAGFTAAE